MKRETFATKTAAPELLRLRNIPDSMIHAGRLVELSGWKRPTEAMPDAVRDEFSRIDTRMTQPEAEKARGLREGFLAPARRRETVLRAKVPEGLVAAVARIPDPHCHAARQLAVIAFAEAIPAHARPENAPGLGVLLLFAPPPGVDLPPTPWRSGHLLVERWLEPGGTCGMRGSILTGVTPGTVPQQADKWLELLTGGRVLGEIDKPLMPPGERCARELAKREIGHLAVFPHYEPGQVHGYLTSGAPAKQLVPLVAGPSLVPTAGGIEIGPSTTVDIQVDAGSTFAVDGAPHALAIISLLKGRDDPRFEAMKAALGFYVIGSPTYARGDGRRLASSTSATTFMALAALNRREREPVQTFANVATESGTVWAATTQAPGPPPVLMYQQGDVIVANSSGTPWRVHGCPEDSGDRLRRLSPLEWRTLQMALFGRCERPEPSDRWVNWAEQVAELFGRDWRIPQPAEEVQQ